MGCQWLRRALELAPNRGIRKGLPVIALRGCVRMNRGASIQPDCRVRSGAAMGWARARNGIGFSVLGLQRARKFSSLVK